ncbi:MAG: copper resistance CopC/CopD family protein [Longimicrobiales bacterium]
MRLWTSVALAAVFALAPPGVAAHTELERSWPAAGEQVAAPLAEIRLRFTQAVEAAYTSLRLIGPDGKEVRAATLTVVEGSGRREFISARPAFHQPGEYRVEWRTAGADGHPIEGAFTFVVTAMAVVRDSGLTPPTDPSAAVPEPHAVAAQEARAPGPTPGWLDVGSPLQIAVRWLYFAALIATIGAVAFRLIVVRRVERAGRHAAALIIADRAVWSGAAAAAAVLASAAVIRLWLQSATLHGLARAWDPGLLAAYLTTTGWGRAWLLQAALLVLLAVALAAARGGRPRGWRLAAGAAVGLGVIPALSGHAAAVESFRFLATALDWLHVLAASLWLGMLLVMLWVIASLYRADELPDRLDGIAALVRRFSPLALLGAGVLLTSGLGNAFFHFHTLSEVWRTSYGQALLLKLTLLGVVALLGFYNWRVVRPRLGTEPTTARLRRSASAELTVGALVVLITAVLVALPTPKP